MAIGRGTYIVGFLLFVVLTASIYVMLPSSVKIKVNPTNTEFFVYEEGGWTTGGIEYIYLYNGTRKLNAINRSVDAVYDGNLTNITRTVNFPCGKIADTYEFDGSTSDVEKVPINHRIERTGCNKMIVQIEYQRLSYDGITRDAVSPESFGHNIKIEWSEGAYFAKVYQQLYDKLVIKYKANNDYEVYNVKMTDPFVPSDFLELIENTNTCVIDCYTIYKVKNPTDFDYTIDSDTKKFLVQFIKNKARDRKIEIQLNRTINDTYTNTTLIGCYPYNITTINLTQETIDNCTYKDVPYQTSYQESYWKEFNPMGKTFKAHTFYFIKISGKLDWRESEDNVIYFNKYNYTEYAFWNSDAANRTEFNVTTGPRGLFEYNFSSTLSEINPNGWAGITVSKDGKGGLEEQYPYQELYKNQVGSKANLSTTGVTQFWIYQGVGGTNLTDGSEALFSGWDDATQGNQSGTKWNEYGKLKWNGTYYLTEGYTETMANFTTAIDSSKNATIIAETFTTGAQAGNTMFVSLKTRSANKEGWTTYREVFSIFSGTTNVVMAYGPWDAGHVPIAPKSTIDGVTIIRRMQIINSTATLINGSIFNTGYINGSQGTGTVFDNRYVTFQFSGISNTAFYVKKIYITQDQRMQDAQLYSTEPTFTWGAIELNVPAASFIPSLHFPANLSIYDGTTLTANVSSTELSNINCSGFLDGIYIGSNGSVNNNTPFNLTIAKQKYDGNRHAWNMTCNGTWSGINYFNSTNDTKPVQKIINLSPSVAYRNDIMTCMANFTDDRNATMSLNLSFYVNNILNYSAFNSTYNNGTSWNITLTTTFKPTDVIYCNATISDGVTGQYGLNNYTNKSNSVTILNRAPIISLLSLEPVITYSNEPTTIFCNVTARDGDDLVFYSMNASIFRNGGFNASRVNLSYNNNTLMNFSFYGMWKGGDNLTCNVTVNDKYINVSNGSNSITLQEKTWKVYLIYPANASTFINSSFTFNVTGDLSIYNCSIYVDNIFKGSNKSTNNNTATNFTIPIQSRIAWHNWSVICNGTRNETRWWFESDINATITITSGTNFTIRPNCSGRTFYELPNYGYSNSWINMSGNVLLLHLNNASGENNTFVKDWSGNGNNGTGVNITSTNNGKLNGAINLNYNGSYVKFTDSPLIKQNYSSTVSVWVSLNDRKRGYLFAKAYGSSAAGRGGSIQIGSGGFSYAMVNMSNSFTAYSGTEHNINTISLNTWYHVVGTYDNETGSVKIYVNGIFKGNHTLPLPTVTSTGTGFAYLGTELNTGIPIYINASIDEVAIWNRSLSSAEILSIYSHSNHSDDCIVQPSGQNSTLGLFTFTVGGLIDLANTYNIFAWIMDRGISSGIDIYMAPNSTLATARKLTNYISPKWYNQTTNNRSESYGNINWTPITQINYSTYIYIQVPKNDSRTGVLNNLSNVTITMTGVPLYGG